MTKKERAIIMAYTGAVLFTGDDVGYFLGYVKEKTGIELNVLDWSKSDIPIIDFGSTKKEVDETIRKIRKACKKDFDDLIRSCNEEEEDGGVPISEADLEKFAGIKVKIKSNEKKEEKPEEEKNEKKDAEMSVKKLRALEKILGRDLRPDEVFLLAMFDSLEIVKSGEKKEEKPENTRVVFKKTSDCDTCRNFSKVFNKPEDMHKCMHACTKQAHTGSWEVEDLLITLVFLEAILGKDLGSKLEKESKKDLLKHMCEHCCDNKEDKNGR